MKKFFSLLFVALLSTMMFAESITVTKAVWQLAQENNWVPSSSDGSVTSAFPSIALDEVVTVNCVDTPATTQMNAVYWANATDSTKSDVRFYQARSNGWVSVSVKEGYELESVKFTYTVSKTGILATESGSSIAEDKRILSETVYACSGQSVMFYVANTGTATNGQVRITKFEITYKSTAVEKKPFKVKAGEDLQAAINAAESGDTILVQAGTYTGNFTMKDGVQLIGGWNADFTAQTDYASVLDANKNGRVLNQPADFTTLTIVENFTIQNGYLETSSDQGAAGVWLCRKGRVQHCLIQDNKITTSPSGNMMGGGVSCNTGMADPDTLVYDCIIRRNTATHGGGIRVNGKGIVILNSVIEDNETVNNAAGGVHMHNGSKLINCIVRNNKANGDTGGVRLSGGNVSDIFNCLIAGNVATASVGGVAIEGNNKANFINNTVVANKQMKAGATASLAGVKVKNDIGGAATTLFVNNIIWGNITGDTIAPQGVYYISKYDKTSGARSYNAIQGQYGDDDKTGTTSWMLTNDDPGFVNAANGDYRLAASSALHNIGSTAQAQGTKDLAGNARILQDIVDLGCYETEYVAPMVHPYHYTYDFGTPAANPWNFPTAAKDGKIVADTVSYTNAGSQITLIDTQDGCQILCDTGLLMGTQYAGIILPVMDFPVGKIVVNYDAKMDANTEVAVTSLAKTSGGGIVIKPAPAAGGLTPGGGGGLVIGIPYTEYATARLKGPGADNTQTFTIKPEYAAVGTQYVLRVTTSGKYMLVHSVTLYEAQGVESVALDNHKDTLKVGERLTLTATILPEGAMYKSAVWSTSDNSLASVSTDGKISAKAAGDVEIIYTVTTLTDQIIADTCRLHINPAGEVADDFTVVYDFTSNDCWGLPTVATNVSEEYECESAGASFTAEGATVTGITTTKSLYQYVNNTLLLQAKNAAGAFLKLQSFPFAVGKIVVELDASLTSSTKAQLNITDAGVTQTVLGKTTTVYTTMTQYANLQNVEKGVDSVMTFYIKPDKREAFTDYYVRCFKSGTNVNIKKITVYKHIPATAAAFHQKTFKVSPNKQLQLALDLTPTNTTAMITYTSLNTAVATVDANGVVTAGGAFGTTKIIMDADGLKDTCDLEVCIAPKKVIDFTSNDCWGFPTELTTGEAEYTCNGQTVVVNGASGLMAGQGGYNFDTENNCLLSWVALSPKSNVGFIKLPQFDFPVGKFVVNMNETVTAKSYFTNVGQSLMKAWVWIAYTNTVTGGGKQTYYTTEAGRAVGLDYYYRPSGAGKLYIKSIEVYEYVAPESVTLNKKTLELEIAATDNLSATVAPIDATYEAVTFASLDANVATVDATGLVTAVAAGTTSIVATAGAKTDTCVVTVKPAPIVANKHIMAYDLKAELADGIYTFSFKSNENATDAQIVFYNESVVIGSQNISGVHIGENSIQIAAANLPGENGQVLRWSIDLTSSNIDAVTEFSDDSDKFRYYATRGMAINCYPETEGFGTIYLCVPSAGASDGGSTYTKTMTMGFRQFDAALTLKNDSNVGFTAGMTWLDASTAPYRVQVGEDGLVYFSANHASMKGVWRVNEWDMSTATTGATNVINSGESTYGFCVEGVGAARTIYAMEGIGYDASAGGLGNINKYEIGTADVFSGTPVLVSTANNAKQVNSGDNMATDGNGGFWFYQNRSAEGASMPILAHMTSGVVDYTSADAALGLADSRRGAFAVSPNKQYLACGTAAKVTVFKVVSFNTNNVPTLEKVGEFTSDRLGNNIDGMAFDYANNVYVANSSKEWLQAFALPTTDNSSSVMARVAMSVTVQKTATSVQELINNSYLGVQKVIINGALYIIRDGVMYNMQGQLVK